jgi:hypothetical protein
MMREMSKDFRFNLSVEKTSNVFFVSSPDLPELGLAATDPDAARSVIERTTEKLFQANHGRRVEARVELAPLNDPWESLRNGTLLVTVQNGTLR